MFADYNWIVLDTETGGLSSDKNLIVEIACCAIDTNLTDIGEYTSLIKPYDNTKSIMSQALQANGLTLEDINSGKDSKIVISELIDFFKKNKRGNKKPIIVGHNIDFDISFLVEFFSFHKKDITDFVEEKTEDTMWWSRYRWQESVNYKLGTCVSNAGLELVNAHRALTDTRATKELFKTFIRNLRGEGVSGNNVPDLAKNKRYREKFQF